METYNKAQKKTSRWRRVKQLNSDDEETSDDTTPKKTVIANTGSRSSERIHHKRMRTFRMPSRADVWKRILPCKSPGKYSHLKPRKLVNNFTKENNRYNFDPVYTSGSESMEDFLDDPEGCSGSDSGSSSCSDNKVTKPDETGGDNSGDSGTAEGRHGTVRMRNRLVSDSESGSEGGHVVKDCRRNRSLILESDCEEEMMVSEALFQENVEEQHKKSGENCPTEHGGHNNDCLENLSSENQFKEERVLETMNEDITENQSEHKESENTNSPMGEIHVAESDEDSDQPIRKWRRNSSKNMIVSDDEDSEPEICPVAVTDVAPTDTSQALSLLDEHIETCYGANPQNNVPDEDCAVNRCENCVKKLSEYPKCDCTKPKQEDSSISRNVETIADAVEPEQDIQRCETESSSDSMSESTDDSEQNCSDGNKMLRKSRRFTPRIGMIRKQRAKEAVFEQFRKARRRLLKREHLGK